MARLMSFYKSSKEEAVTIEAFDESLKSSESTLYEGSGFDECYLAKAKLLSASIDEIGFGRYQLGLFFVAGFGWFADNAWPQATSLVMPRLIEDDGVHAPDGRSAYLVLAQNLGLLGGAAFWSLSADIWGRRFAFSMTYLFICVFAISGGAGPNFGAVATFNALMSFGVGGNLPVDSAIFLEVLPTKNQWLLTAMCGWWSIGQIVANLLSWALISNFSCDTSATVCLKKDNKGWRYFLYTMGGLSFIMFLSRFAFRVFESPKFYVARGKDEKAIHTLNKIARINKKETSTTLEDLQAIDAKFDQETEAKEGNFLTSNSLLRDKFQLSHVAECFGTKKLAFSSSLVILSWAIIGLAFPLYVAFLPTYLGKQFSDTPLSVHDVYRNSLIVAALGVPGALFAGFCVELKVGRKGTLMMSLIMSGVFLFASTTAKSNNQQLGWNCAFSFFSNIVYGVLYAYTPEIFPTKVRGTGVGLAASANRIAGVFAPIIQIFANKDNSAPIYVSGALFILCAFVVLIFPFEPRGKSSY